ncbi:MAG: recombinase family protein [Rhodoferax sp.]|nr:recombinase family protein [Rhodoferax sp.]
MVCWYNCYWRGHIIATAYSYVRFSTEKQELGASLARQVQLAENYAKDNSLTLNAQTYQDLGVSAFKGLNATAGALSRFLKACNDGLIPKGSYLLVESLDRLSRDDVQTALQLFQNIIGKGITIVTLSDGQKYSTESINQNWTQLIVALAVMSRANEESKLKSKRIQDGWDKKQARALAGTEILTAKGPSWLKLENGKWSLINDKVDAVRKVFELAIQGHGSPKIAKLLNEKYKISTLATAKYWTQSSVASVLSSVSVIGTFQRRDRPEEEIEGYFPAIIDAEMFAAVREKVIGRRRKSGVRGDVVNNLFSGLLFCPCGSKMRAVNSNKTHHYIRCLRAYSNAGCDAPIVTYKPLEASIVSRLLTVFQTPLGHAEVAPIDPSIAIKAEIEAKQKVVENLVNVLAMGGDAMSKSQTILNRISQTELEIVNLQKAMKHAFTKTPFKATKEKIIDLLGEHFRISQSGTKEELNEMRLRMASTIQTQLTKIVVRTDVGEVERESMLDPNQIITWLGYDLHGPLVDVFRKDDIEKNKNSIYQKGLPFTFTDDGGWHSEYPLYLGPKRDKSTRRRTIKKKLAAT